MVATVRIYARNGLTGTSLRLREGRHHVKVVYRGGIKNIGSFRLYPFTTIRIIQPGNNVYQLDNFSVNSKVVNLLNIRNFKYIYVSRAGSKKYMNPCCNQQQNPNYTDAQLDYLERCGDPCRPCQLPYQAPPVCRPVCCKKSCSSSSSCGCSSCGSCSSSSSSSSSSYPRRRRPRRYRYRRGDPSSSSESSWSTWTWSSDTGSSFSRSRRRGRKYRYRYRY